MGRIKKNKSAARLEWVGELEEFSREVTRPREKPIKKGDFHINPNSNRKRKRSIEFEEISSTSWEKSKRRQLLDRHIIHNIQNVQSPLPEATRSRIIETGCRLEGVCVIKVLYPTDVDSGQCRLSVPLRQVWKRFLFPDEVELLLAHSDRGIRTTLIQPQPCLEECEIRFGLWGSNATYVLKK